MPLHQIMGNFDSNSSSPSEIDALLLKGYNPNQYDANGMSPYHICLIRNQKKGFDYLINISANNPGFFDL
jgi:ankyrin repeat protein